MELLADVLGTTQIQRSSIDDDEDDDDDDEMIDIGVTLARVAVTVKRCWIVES